MKRAIGVGFGFSLPIIGLIIDVYILKDTDLFPIPLTGYGLIWLGLAYFLWVSFKQGALFQTPTLFTEDYPRLHRYPDRPKFVKTKDGMTWVVIPVGGLVFLRAFLTVKNFSPGRGAVAIIPAKLVEEIGSRFYVGRVQLVEMGAPEVLYRVSSFKALFDTFETIPTRIYIGFASQTLHADIEDLKRANIEKFATELQTGQRELKPVVQKLATQLADDIRRLDKAKAKSEVSRRISQSFDREREEEQK